jgi:hypothetical protein
MDDKDTNNGMSLCSTLDKFGHSVGHINARLRIQDSCPSIAAPRSIFSTEREIALLQQGVHFVTQQYVAVLRDEPPRPTDKIVVAEPAAIDVRSSMEPLRTRDGSVAAEMVERDPIRDAGRFRENADPESESEPRISRDTTTHACNSGKRQGEESLIPPKKKAHLRKTGSYMATRYADLRSLCLLFARHFVPGVARVSTPRSWQLIH